MPSSVASLLAAADLEPDGRVDWGDPVPEARTGVYVVSLTPRPVAVDCTHSRVPLSDAALDGLSAVCPGLTLDGEPNPTREQLAARIGAYWLPDECVLYIGLSGQPLRARVRQYYVTPLGAAKPHKGGWWLKILSVLDELHVHYSATAKFKDAEEDMLRAFATNVSSTSRAALPAGEPVMPFANLRDAAWRRRSHRIGGATTATPPRRRASARAGTVSPRAPARARQAAAPHCSQIITDRDIQTGQIRIPRGVTKQILPRERCNITVIFRGREMSCRWDPRYGPPERSGVIRVGKVVARELLQAGDALAVTASVGGIVGLD